MRYREYGRTGVEVSAIGFGGMRFRDPQDDDACAALVKRAWEAGINYFDTAPGYGRSEELFGLAFRDMLPARAQHPFYVATKTFGVDESAVRRDLETSLERMGLPSIDFFHMWCILTLDNYRDRARQGALKAMEKARDEGLIRHLCVSTHLPGHAIGALLKDYPFEGVLLGYSAANFAYREEGVQAAADLGRGVVVMNPLAGGVITRHPERIAYLRTRSGETTEQGAIRIKLDDPRLTVSLVGFSVEAEVEEAVRAVDGYAPLDAAGRERMRQAVGEALDSLCTGCGYCDSCPEGVPIPKLMDACNLLLLGQDEQALAGRLRYHWGIKPGDPVLTACTRCGLCEEACTQQLPIRSRLDAARAAMENQPPPKA